MDSFEIRVINRYYLKVLSGTDFHNEKKNGLENSMFPFSTFDKSIPELKCFRTGG